MWKKIFFDDSVQILCYHPYYKNTVLSSFTFFSFESIEKSSLLEHFSEEEINEINWFFQDVEDNK